MEITSLELDEALCVTSDLPVRPHADLFEKELVMEKSADEDRHVMFGMWTNSIFQQHLILKAGQRAQDEFSSLISPNCTPLLICVFWN